MPITVVINNEPTVNKFPAMSTGLHAAVAVSEEDITDKIARKRSADQPLKKGERLTAVKFKNAKGEEASKIYSNSIFPGSDKAKPSALYTDLQALGIPASDGAQISFVGRQVQLMVIASKNTKGYDSAKVTAVLPPAAGQNVVAA